MGSTKTKSFLYVSYGNPHSGHPHLPEFDSIPLSEYAIIWLNENGKKISSRAFIRCLHENVSLN